MSAVHARRTALTGSTLVARITSIAIFPRNTLWPDAANGPAVSSLPGAFAGNSAASFLSDVVELLC